MRQRPERQEEVGEALSHLEERQRQEAERQAQEQARQRAAQVGIDKFKSFASERSGDGMGYTAERWALLPPPVRELVDEYNGHGYGSAGREEVLKRLVERPELRKGVETALDTAERQQQSRGARR